MIKGQFLYPLLSYEEANGTNYHKTQLKKYSFSNPPALETPAYLLSDFFQLPHLLPPPSIPDWRVTYNPFCHLPIVIVTHIYKCILNSVCMLQKL